MREVNMEVVGNKEQRVGDTAGRATEGEAKFLIDVKIKYKN